MQSYYFQSDQGLSRLGWALPRLPQSLFWSLNHSEVLFCWHPAWLGPLILCIRTASSSRGLLASEISNTSLCSCRSEAGRWPLLLSPVLALHRLRTVRSCLVVSQGTAANIHLTSHCSASAYFPKYMEPSTVCLCSSIPLTHPATFCCLSICF